MNTSFSRLHLWALIIIVITVGCQPSQPSFSPSAAPQNTPDPPQITIHPTPAYWTPEIGSAFQIQLSDYPPDVDIEVDIIELDLFETDTSAIQYLHNKGIKVICYFNAGAWEEFRPDADTFPVSVIGKKYQGWPGEEWLDIAHFDAFSNIMEQRFDLAVEKDCDGVDPDNINGYLQDTGFEISAQDQLAYNIWLSEQAHIRNLAISLKNNNLQVLSLIKYFDFAVIEDCAVFQECKDFLPFINSGKPVFQIEYTDQFNSTGDFCSGSSSLGYTGLLKNRKLDAFIQFCN